MANTARADRKDEKSLVASGKETARLFFDLNSAGLIPKCMMAQSQVHRNRGPIKDLWDEGFGLGDSSNRMAFVLLLVVSLLSVEWLARKLLKLA
jgi:hypothetical protein